MKYPSKNFGVVFGKGAVPVLGEMRGNVAVALQGKVWLGYLGTFEGVGWSVF